MNNDNGANSQFLIETTQMGGLPEVVLNRYTGKDSTVIIPEGVTCIGNSAFAGNLYVQRVVLPESLRSIGDGAFLDCKNLRGFNTPAALRVISRIAFAGCVSLEDVRLPESVSVVERTSFAECSKLFDRWSREHLCPLCGGKLQGFLQKRCNRCNTRI